MKTCYAHCILKFIAEDDFQKDALKQGLLEVLDEVGLEAVMCNIEFEDEE